MNIRGSGLKIRCRLGWHSWLAVPRIKPPTVLAPHHYRHFGVVCEYCGRRPVGPKRKEIRRKAIESQWGTR